MTAFRLGPASFTEALAAAKRRRVVLPGEFYGRLQGQARAAAFTVSRLAQVRQIEAIRRSLEADLKAGGDFEAWRARVLADPRFGHLTPAHLETVYRTNIQAHHAAGRAVSILAHEKARPFLLYSAILDTRVRPEHAALHGLILPVGHPFWRTHMPPLGFNCRCQVIGLSKRQAEARIAAARAKGKAVDVAPAGDFTDEGWAYDRLHAAPTTGPARAVRRKAERTPDAAPAARLVTAEEARAAARELAIAEAGAWCLAEARPLARGSIEFAAGVGPDGAVILRKRGGKNHVDFTTAEQAQLRGATLVHNHPSGASLSRPDFVAGAHFGLAEIVAVGEGGAVYRGRSLLPPEAAQRALRAVDNDVFNRVSRLFHAGVVGEHAAEWWHPHIVNSVAAARGLVRYEAHGLPPVPLWAQEVIRELSP